MGSSSGPRTEALQFETPSLISTPIHSVFRWGQDVGAQSKAASTKEAGCPPGCVGRCRALGSGTNFDSTSQKNVSPVWNCLLSCHSLGFQVQLPFSLLHVTFRDATARGLNGSEVASVILQKVLLLYGMSE